MGRNVMDPGNLPPSLPDSNQTYIVSVKEGNCFQGRGGEGRIQGRGWG